MDPFERMQQQMRNVNSHTEDSKVKREGLQPGESIIMSVDNALSPQQTAELRSLVNQDSIQSIVSKKEEFTNNDEVRRSQVHWLAPDKHEHIYQTVLGIAENSNKKYQFKISAIDQRIQLAIYDESVQGFYRWHMDWGGGALQRKISISIPLNDPSEYEGGNLEFNINGDSISLPQKMGAAIVFPSFILHRVTPVTKGRRYSLVAWIKGEF
ncbi:2OG-Fe(II) oxygenase [Oceanicoccus sagamiensis]|uniref:Fe2OG dioxygenase domain-containing protein n=1 Tax=Oceanicoccus sagamiensis TaxID=716816 RepID=A0A1X9NLS5_9GAMM|nr:2OG-Fe(II) oxygenase [Oceanicoccus sagamiensis]ARN74893.1 hypothetical protein BST96_12670 [Oceanicoccus sagamiensis]